MPKVDKINKGLHFRVGQWHNKEELHDAISNHKPRQQLFGEVTEDLMQEYDTDDDVEADEHLAPHATTSHQATDATSNSDDGMWGSDVDDDTNNNVSVQGVGTLVCLPDGTFTGMHCDEDGIPVVACRPHTGHVPTQAML